ncbi:MAG: metallophosphoesterase [Anaerolineales bacterium]|nr:metallophosphoesterase [Anaerolineales bacterium]
MAFSKHASRLQFAPRKSSRRHRHQWKFLRRLGESVIERYDWRYRLVPEQLTVERVTIRLPHLPRAFHGFTLVQLSDFHYGPLVEPASLSIAFDVARALRPDLFVVTGDFVSRLTRAEGEWLQRELSRLSATEGAFAVLGNHDWWEDGDRVAEAVEAAGVRVLRNEHVVLQRDGAALYLAGVDDVRAGADDLPCALHGIPPEACVLLLAHEPYFAETAARTGRVALQLSGHSHGGQVRVPILEPLILWGLGHHKYPRGLNRVSEMLVYTNRGLGVVGLPLRYNCPPEVTHLTLHAP